MLRTCLWQSRKSPSELWKYWLDACAKRKNVSNKRCLVEPAGDALGSNVRRTPYRYDRDNARSSRRTTWGLSRNRYDGVEQPSQTRISLDWPQTDPCFGYCPARKNL